MAKLYHYVHCPFCIRVRMAAGFLKIPYESIVLSYDDEKTPMDLMGKKMLPIYENNGSLSNESLQIIEDLDSENVLFNYQDDQGKISDFNAYLGKIGSNIHSAFMPYCIYAPDFDENARKYFLAKKEQKRGPFHLLAQKQEKFLKAVKEELAVLENNLHPYYNNENFNLLDIMLASHLWGMYLVPEFQFSQTWHNYLQNVKKLTSFNYHEDFWRKPL